MRRRILVAFITSILQAVVYYVLFYLFWQIGTAMYSPEDGDLQSLVRLSMIVFCVLVLGMNLIDAAINQRKWAWRLLCIVMVIHLLFWGQYVNDIPLKATLFLVTGFIAIFAKVPLHSFLKKAFVRTNPGDL